MSLLSSNLQAFLAIVGQGTVHGAAKDLGLTQTAVTQRLRSLEESLGTTLFLRSRRGMKLTTEGDLLHRYCRNVKDLDGDILSRISGSGSSSPVQVTIAGPTSVLAARIVPACRPLYRDWPNLFLHFVFDDSIHRLEMVRSGKATLAILPPAEVPNEMESKRLKAERYVLVASPRWKGRRLSEILETERIIDFEDRDSTTLRYLEKSQLADQARRPRLFVNNNAAIIQMFSAGIGFGTLTQETAKPHLDRGDLICLNGGTVLEDPLALAWYPRPQMPPYFAQIVRTIR